MANSRSVHKKKLGLWLTASQRTALKVIARELGFDTVTDLFAAVAERMVHVDLRPNVARSMPQLIEDQRN